AGRKADQAAARLDRLDELAAFEENHERQHRAHDAAALVEIPVDHARLVERDMLSGDEIGPGAYPAASAPSKEFERLAVPAPGQRDPRIIARKAMDACHIAGAFFDRDDVRYVGNGGEERIAHAHAHACRVVVKHDWQAGRLVDRLHMRRDLLLRGDRIGWGRNQNGVGRNLLRSLRIGNGILPPDGAGAYY